MGDIRKQAAEGALGVDVGGFGGRGPRDGSQHPARCPRTHRQRGVRWRRNGALLHHGAATASFGRQPARQDETTRQILYGTSREIYYWDFKKDWKRQQGAPYKNPHNAAKTKLPHSKDQVSRWNPDLLVASSLGPAAGAKKKCLPQPLLRRLIVSCPCNTSLSSLLLHIIYSTEAYFSQYLNRKHIESIGSLQFAGKLPTPPPAHELSSMTPRPLFARPPPPGHT